jgi:hypothetical protein
MRYAAMMIMGLLTTVPAAAATVTRDFELTASNFANFTNDPSPITALKANFRLTYDDMKAGFVGAPVSFTSITNGVANVGPFSATPIFGYFPAGGMNAFPRIGVGGALNGGNVLVNRTDDFYFTFDAQATGPTRAMLSFTSSAFATPFIATNAFVTALATVPAVPEPAAWAMLTIGFGLIGGTMRRQRRRTPHFA